MSSTMKTSVVLQDNELTIEELIRQNMALKEKSIVNQQKLEAKRKLLHETRTELERRRATHQEQKNELEELQIRKRIQSDALKQRETQLRTESENNEKKINQEKEILKTVYDEKFAQLEKFEKEVLLAEQENDNKKHDERNQLFNKNILLKQHVEELSSKLKDLYQNLNAEEITEVENIMKETRNECEELQQKESFLQSALEESTALRETFDGDLAMLKMDHLALRTQRQETDPNSLFNEVDERRVVLQEDYNKMRTTYLARKEEFNQFRQKLNGLRMENVQLKQTWLEDCKAKDFINHLVRISHDNAIGALQDVDKELEKMKEEREELSRSPTKMMQFEFHDNKDTKIEQLKERNATGKYMNSDFSYKIAQCTREIDRIKLKISELTGKNADLRLELEAADALALDANIGCVCALKRNSK